MKTMTYAEFAAQAEGTIFEFNYGPARHAPGMYRKGVTWRDDDAGGVEPGISILNLSYLIENGEEPGTATSEFLEAWRGEDCEFRVYEPADLDRFAGLIGRGRAAQQAGGER